MKYKHICMQRNICQRNRRKQPSKEGRARKDKIGAKQGRDDAREVLSQSFRHACLNSWAMSRMTPCRRLSHRYSQGLAIISQPILVASLALFRPMDAPSHYLWCCWSWQNMTSRWLHGFMFTGFAKEADSTGTCTGRHSLKPAEICTTCNFSHGNSWPSIMWWP